MPTTHQPDQDVYSSILPEDVDWEPFALPAFGPPRGPRRSSD